jgi:tRNA-splicing ligase RtcB
MSNIFGTHDEKTLEQFRTIENQSVASALMADGHLGYVMPVGGVAAYDNQVSVVGVGFDIACGNCAIKTNKKLSEISHRNWTIAELENNPFGTSQDKYLNELATRISQNISFGIGRVNRLNDAPNDDIVFHDSAWWIIPNTNNGKYRDTLMEKARDQLGTIGSGNHYVDVFVDEDDYIWVGVHFGSRGLGHTIASNFLAIGQGGTWGDKGKEVETLLDLDTQVGKDYWGLMELAGSYAYAGREWVARKVMSLFEGEELDLVHNHHNFAWKEIHAIPVTRGESLHTPLANYEKREVVVIRKGATPAFPNQRGFVGGSMGDNAVILKGSECNIPSDDDFDIIDINYGGKDGNTKLSQVDALYSTVHGAGRVMSRNEAAGKVNRKTGVRKTHGKISHEDMQTWLQNRGVILRGGGLDEAPQAYRRLPDVLAAQGDTIEVLHTLRPVIVVMAGANEFDPYKD